MKLIIRSSIYVLVLTVLLGGIYPAIVYGLGQLFWREKANGSFVKSGGRVVGSELIGQGFQGPQYLHSPPSAARKTGDDPTSTRGPQKRPAEPAPARA